MMKREIVLFTGTGNTLFVARELARDDEIHFVAEYLEGARRLPDDLTDLGIMYPTYVGTLPKDVVRFVNEILAERDNSHLDYVFGVTTYGGMKGTANGYLESLLREIGVHLAYSRSIKMPNAFLPLKHHAMSEMGTLAFVNKKLNKIDEIKAEILDHEVKLDFSSRLVMNLHKNLMEQKEKWFENGLRLNNECNGCTICYRICPENNIKMKDGHPVFGEECCGCYACYHRCPEHALEYKKAKGQYKGLQMTSELFRR